MTRQINVAPIPNASAQFLPKSVRSDLLSDAAVEARNIAVGAVTRLALSADVQEEIDANAAAVNSLQSQLNRIAQGLEDAPDAPVVNTAFFEAALNRLEALIEVNATAINRLRLASGQIELRAGDNVKITQSGSTYTISATAREGTGLTESEVQDLIDESIEAELEGLETGGITQARADARYLRGITAGTGISVGGRTTGGTQSVTATGRATVDPSDLPPLGGDLTGTIGNAQIAAGAVGTTEIAAAARTSIITAATRAATNAVSAWARVGNAAIIPSNKIYGAGRSFATTAAAWLTKANLYGRLKSIIVEG